VRTRSPPVTFEPAEAVADDAHVFLR
jgi:hypothetical protein